MTFQNYKNRRHDNPKEEYSYEHHTPENNLFANMWSPFLGVEIPYIIQK
jgi:hypothetical protein